ncbi:GDSL-type esterase/lipase family protein [Heyndrickxia vini]|uniref:SGNH/GDSL hydrolase family protein n=1 Tax=Heyndrickxia vini TaxID=1476025 RepID=A0ABX7DXJ4_9BACI|nr:GDSL-type esterase/lipase family protein [Heyndrickxia vini]QQZ07640.1 SGNH/GDSL hydrolase family protein [Heyndrickxia vini]
MKIALIGDSLTEGRPGVSFFNILKKKFPDITFVNLGKPGESVKSLYTRLIKTKLDIDYDLSFLWIGVNDVYSKLLSVQAQPVAKDHDEFKDCYEKVLGLVLGSSKKVVAVTPALVGENTDNAPNNEITELNDLIQSIISKQTNVSFLDIQSVFLSHLSKVSSSDYISTKVMRVMMDVLFYRKPSRIDRLSKERGLHLTLDGIHLNSAGAQIVAETYASEIERFLTYKNRDAIQ